MEDKKKTILIVDDDSFLLDMYALKFSQSGFTVDTALGSTVALQKLKQSVSPDILLTDIVMPVMDGFELLEKINEEKLIPNTIKIIISNLGQTEDIERGKALGASGYIVKANATPSEVVARVVSITQPKQQ